VDRDPIFEALSSHDKSFTVDRKEGFWKINREVVARASPPYHGDLLPTNQRAEERASARSASDHRTQEDHARTPVAISNNVQSNKSATEEVPPTPHDRPADVESTNALPSRVNPSKDGPTDAQVEAYLRDKYSNNPRTQV
jgi:hypothetical protein